MPSDRALLVAAGGGIGDTLLAGVVAHALRERYAAVDALVLPAHRDVLSHDPAIAQIDVLDDLRAAVARTRARRYAASIVTWATLPTALIPFLARIPVRVGQARRLYSGLFTRRVVVRSERGDRTSHWTDVLLDYARALGCELEHAQPVFIPSAEDRNAARALCEAHDVRGSYRVLHATRGVSSQHTRWPLTGFIALVHALRALDGAPVLLSGSRDDRVLIEELAARSGAIAVAGATSIGGFAALAQAARSVIAMDSGPMHVAAAVGAPTVGIFALQSDEPDRWAPRGAATAVVRASYPCPAIDRKETCPNFACVRELDVPAILRGLAGLEGRLPESSP